MQYNKPRTQRVEKDSYWEHRVPLPADTSLQLRDIQKPSFKQQVLSQSVLSPAEARSARSTSPRPKSVSRIPYIGRSHSRLNESNLLTKDE